MDDVDHSTGVWGEDTADLRAVVDSQRETIARLQREREEDRATIARLEAVLRDDLREDPPAPR